MGEHKRAFQGHQIVPKLTFNVSVSFPHVLSTSAKLPLLLSQHMQIRGIYDSKHPWGKLWVIM